MGDSSHELNIEELWIRYSEGLRWLAASLVSDKSQIDDLVQQAFLEAQRRPPRATGSAFGWLSTVLRNCSIREKRRRERAARRELKRELHNRVESLSPSELNEHADTYRTILGAIQELPGECSSALLMRFIQGKSAEEIAEAQGCATSTIRSRISRGRARLAAKLDAKLPGWKLDFLAMLGIDLTAILRKLEPVAKAAPAAVSKPMALKATLGTLLLGGALGAILLWTGSEGPARAAAGENGAGAPERFAASLESENAAAVAGEATRSVAMDRQTEPMSRRDQPTAPDRGSEAASEGFVLFVRFATPDGHSFAEVAEENPLLRDLRLHPNVTAAAPLGDYPPNELEDFSLLGYAKFQRRIESPALLQRLSDRRRELQEAIPPGFDGYLIVDPAVGSEPYVSPFMRNVLCGDPVRVELGTQDEVTLTVNPEWIEGKLATLQARFVDAYTGEPIRDLEVSLQSSQGQVGHGVTDQDGVVRLTGVMPGRVILVGWSPDYEAVRRVVYLQAGPIPLEKEYPLSAAASASGRVVDADGQPVPQAQVSAYPLGAVPFPENIATALFSLPADANGEFEALGLGEGSYWLKASAPAGSELCSGGVVLSTSGGPVENVEIPLSQGVPVTLITDWPRAEPRYLSVTPAGQPEHVLFAQTVSGQSEYPLRLEQGATLDFLLADSAGTMASLSDVVIHQPGEVIHLAP